MTKRAFGELEAEILYILKGKERMMVKEVVRALGNRDNYNTVMTVMNRLVEKGQLGRERCGLQCQYWIIEKAKPFSFLMRFKEKLFGMKTAAMVNYLIDSAQDLTDEDFKEMEKMLQQAKERKKS